PGTASQYARRIGLGGVAFGRSDLALGEACQVKNGAAVLWFLLLLDHHFTSRALRFGLASAVGTLARRSTCNFLGNPTTFRPGTVLGGFSNRPETVLAWHSAGEAAKCG